MATLDEIWDSIGIYDCNTSSKELDNEPLAMPRFPNIKTEMADPHEQTDDKPASSILHQDCLHDIKVELKEEYESCGKSLPPIVKRDQLCVGSGASDNSSSLLDSSVEHHEYDVYLLKEEPEDTQEWCDGEMIDIGKSEQDHVKSVPDDSSNTCSSDSADLLQGSPPTFSSSNTGPGDVEPCTRNHIKSATQLEQADAKCEDVDHSSTSQGRINTSRSTVCKRAVNDEGKHKGSPVSNIADVDVDRSDHESALQGSEQWRPKLYKALLRFQAMGELTKVPAETLNKMVEQGSTENAMVCMFCRKEWTSFRQMATHIYSHATGKLFSCSKCGRDFKTKELYEMHCDLHLLGLWQENDTLGSRQIACQMCHAFFETRLQLISHMDTHKDEINPYRCGCCAKRSRTTALRVQHENRHWKALGRKSKYGCSLCERTFSDRIDLKRHVTFHNLFNPDTEEYSCDKCSWKAHSAWSIEKHMHKHSFRAVCNQCGNMFMNLEKHKPQCNGLEGKPAKYQCERCGKRFRTKQVLGRHLAIHSGERRFECQHCGLTFNQVSARNRHVKRHFKDGEYRDVIKYPKRRANRVNRQQYL